MCHACWCACRAPCICAGPTQGTHDWVCEILTAFLALAGENRICEALSCAGEVKHEAPKWCELVLSGGEPRDVWDLTGGPDCVIDLALNPAPIRHALEMEGLPKADCLRRGGVAVLHERVIAIGLDVGLEDFPSLVQVHEASALHQGCHSLHLPLPSLLRSLK